MTYSADLPRRLERIIWLRGGLANLGGALPLVILGGTYVRNFHPRHTAIPLFWIGVLMTVALFVPMWATTRYFLRRFLRKATAWMDEGRAPSSEERRATARLPLTISALPGPWWLLALVLALTIVEVLHAAPNASALVVGGVGILLGGVVSCTLCYLVAEDVLRPLFAQVLAEDGYWSGQGRGIRGRLVAYWLAGSGAYLFGIALILENFPPHIARTIGIVCCALGAAIGFVMTLLSAGSITRPLNKLREGMMRVAGGDLDATVDVDDPGDVGLLQSGFNRMVSGLRERDHLQQTFGRYVGPSVARRALHDDAGLLAGEVTVTILFVDMVGSTTFAAEREPRTVVEMLNAFFGAVVDAAGAEGGFVNQFQGDGALCVFGAPDELPDHAARGLSAAAEMRREIARLGDTYPSFDAAIGLSTGKVVAGEVGTKDRREYTVIGDPVNEAARLCDEAKRRPTRVIASAATITAAGGAGGDWLCCGEVDLRGRPQPTVIFEPSTA
jgi:adenylate cyclase